MRWEEAVTLVTGASRGIGRAVARAAAGKGARLGLVARNQEDLEQVLDEIGGRGVVVAADVGDLTQVQAAVAKVEAALGPVDIVVANAGIGLYGPFLEAAPDEIDRLVKVNFLGTTYLLRTVLPGMVARRRGHAVTIASISGRLAATFEAVYSSTKFAQVGLMEALAVELSPFGIGVSIVNPGPVDTAFFEARGTEYQRSWPSKVPADQVATAVIRAVERRRLERFVPGWLRQTVMVRHLAPSLYLSGTRRAFRKELAELARPR